jgi:ribosomal protein S12 methylthiotransferase accessory factor
MSLVAEHCYPFVDLHTLPEPLRAVVDKVERAGARIDLRWVASDVAVPVFLCVIYEQQGPLRMVHSGAGAHPDAAVAARRAITEAAQSRATYIHGVREDLASAALDEHDGPRGGWFDPTAPHVDYGTLRSHESASVTEDLRYMARSLRAVGLTEIFAVDLSHPAIPFTVARVIVPGAEPPPDFRDRSRITLGWRARHMLECEQPMAPADKRRGGVTEERGFSPVRSEVAG